MHFTDRLLLTWYSTEAIAAAMPAGMLHFAIICLPLGIASYVTTFVAQYFGAQRYERIGLIVWQGVLVGVATIPGLLASIVLAPTFFQNVGHPPTVVAEEVRYFQALAYGGGATVISAAMAAFFTGLGQTRIVMWIDAMGALLNCVLDYLMIYGVLGFTELGITGAGLATSIALWVKVVLYAAIMAQARYRTPYALFEGLRWDGPLMARLMRFGGPSGLQLFIEIAAFTTMTFMMGQLGETAMAATTVAFSVNSIAFVPMLGLGIAVTTMVGQQLGANRADLAERATWTAFRMGLVYTGIMAALYVALPGTFLLAHAAGTRGDFTEIASLSKVLLRFVAAYCVIDMAQIVFSSAVKGAGDTRFVLATAAFVSPVPALLGWLGLKQWGWGLFSFWYLITAWIFALGLIFLLRFWLGPWREMRVIEPDWT